MDDIRHTIPAGSNRFTDQVRQDLRDRGYAYQSELLNLRVKDLDFGLGTLTVRYG